MRYIIGIDLGTTNSCVAYIDTRESRTKVHPFKIPQLKSLGSVEPMPTLPSFCYLAHSHEWPAESMSLPWKGASVPSSSYFVGAFARAQGARVPTRLVQSAKSWLCHHAANRTGRILPVEASEESIRISPIEATSRYLGHLRNAWNHVMANGNPEADFDEQEIVLTVPASFDEAARTLTVDAAKKAGFARMTLLEEPQAAFYSWIAHHETSWDKKLAPGSQILVCDVGGGTTDFSMIEVVGGDGKLSLRRMAVGDHLLLGGDNMDAAVMHWMESMFAERGNELSALQRLQLLHEARRVKEEAFQSSSPKDPQACSVLIQGGGSKVVGGTLSLDVAFGEVRKLLLNGFFPVNSWEEAVRLRKASGLRAMGLPYEDDPSITKHLACFLSKNSSDDGKPLRPDFVLFNGGAMKPEAFQEAIVGSLKSWFPGREVTVLPSQTLDLAVALGAAYYGKTRRGEGIKIGGGLARGCYLILDTVDKEGKNGRKALALLPRGSEEGEVFESPSTFMLTPNIPVSFRLGSSHVRLHDAKGDLVTVNADEMQLLPPIHTVLRFGKKQLSQSSQEKIPVRMKACLTQVGTIEIYLNALASGNEWKLEFQVKSASGQEDAMASIADGVDAGQTFQSGFLTEAERVLDGSYGDGSTPAAIMKLTEKLEDALGMPRVEWPSAVARSLYDALIKRAPYRKVSVAHWERWWNLAGFLLRPGFGYPLDDFRIKELWKIILADSKSDIPAEVQTQLWIAYRRVAGGMNKGQQMQLGIDLLASILGKRGEKIEIRSKSELYPYSEKVRALAAMELIDVSVKIRLANALVRRIVEGNALPAEYWAVGRIGARHLVYGSIAHVVPAKLSEEWIAAILTTSALGAGSASPALMLMIEQLARKTEHRELNISGQCVDKVLNHFKGTDGSGRLEELLLNESRLSLKEQDHVIGDHLPSGLYLEVES